jgi:hypothetical protein
MSPSLLFSVSAIYMGLVGILYVFAPFVVLHGLEADASAFLIAEIRIGASTFFGYALLNWLARNVEQSRARDAIFWANVVGFALAAILTALAALSGGDVMGWIIAVVNALFAVGFYLVGRANMSS